MILQVHGAFGYTGPASEVGVALPLPFSAEIDPKVTPVPVFVVYPDTAHLGSFFTQVRSILLDAPGTPDSFYRTRDHLVAVDFVSTTEA